MKLKAVILDDEPVARNVLILMLNSFAPTVSVVAETSTISQGYEAIKKWKPDIVFLDMELNSENGLDLFLKFDAIDFQVVIISAHERFAINSYTFDVTDYLLKPLTPSHLKRSIGKVLERHLLKQSAREIQIDQKVTNELKIPFGSSYRYIQIPDLIRLEANRNYSWIYLAKEKAFLISKTLGLLEKLTQPFKFLRIHNSHLINPDYIQTFEKAEEKIVLLDGTILPVSRDKKKILVEYFDRNRG